MKLQELRMSKDFSLREAAKAAGIQPRKLSDYEFGRDLPSTGQIELLAKLYGVDSQEIRRCLPAKEKSIALAERAGKMLEAIASTHRDAEAHGLKSGNGGTGSLICPSCGTGTINYSVASVNGHIWGRCSTSGCAAWME